MGKIQLNCEEANCIYYNMYYLTHLKHQGQNVEYFQQQRCTGDRYGIAVQHTLYLVCVLQSNGVSEEEENERCTDVQRGPRRG